MNEAKEMEKRKTPLSYLKNLDLIVAGAAIVVLVVVTFLNVILRYGFNTPLAWGEEVQLWLFVWISFLGAGAAFRSNSHVGIEFVVEKLPQSCQKFIDIIIFAIVVVVLVFVAWQSCVIVDQMMMMNRVTNILHVPNALIYAAVPLGCVIMIISYTAVFWEQIHSGGNK